jgi:hypothetical protein
MLHGKFLARGAAAGLLGLMMASGCGDDPVAGDPTKFIGTWTVSTGQATATCAGVAIPLNLAGEVITISPGVTSPLIALYKGCTIAFDITGNTATAQAGQMCDMNLSYMNLPLSAKVSTTSASFVVAGTSATFMHMGTGTPNTTISLLPAGTGCPIAVTVAATKAP